MNITKLISTIDGEDIKEYEDGSVRYRAKAAIDCDGSGSSHGDPYYQPDTSLHLHGEPLNADVDKYVVVPPAIIQGVKGTVLGCLAHVRNSHNDLETFAVVGDIGPRKKIGEISCACAAAIGLDPSPTRGGTDAHIIEYTIWPGRPAEVDGKKYQLQPLAQRKE